MPLIQSSIVAIFESGLPGFGRSDQVEIKLNCLDLHLIDAGKANIAGALVAVKTQPQQLKLSTDRSREIALCVERNQINDGGRASPQ